MTPGLRPLLVVAALLGASGAHAARVDAGAARLLTDAVAVAVQKQPAVDVLTNEDVRRAMDFEASKQALGCDATGCLAELADALGASFVVHGSVGGLGDELALTLNLFDSASARSMGRVLVRAPSIGALADRVPGAVSELWQARPVGEARLRVLVLALQNTDVGADGGADPAAAGAGAAVADAPGPPLLALAGGGLVVLGALAGAGGAVLFGVASERHSVAANEETTQRDAKAALEERDGFGWGATGLFGLAAACIIGGVTAVVIGLQGE
jgi:hypothetical protein